MFSYLLVSTCLSLQQLTLKTLLNQKQINENEIRFFLGYAGWSPDQLEEELKEKSWFVRENTYYNILDIKVDQLWKSNLLALGSKYQIWVNAPSNPSLN